MPATNSATASVPMSLTYMVLLTTWAGVAPAAANAAARFRKAFAAWARDYVISKPKVMVWLRRSFAGTFGFLGLRLALAER